MQRAFKYRIYPSKAQGTKLDATLSFCCELYNAALQERRDAWRMARTSINYHAQAVQLPDIKALRPELGMVHSQVLQDVLRRLDKAFDAFFRRVKAGEKPGFPRFRSRSRYDSITYPQSGFAIESGKLRLSKIGRVKIKLHRPIDGKVKTLTVRRTATGIIHRDIKPENIMVRLDGYVKVLDFGLAKLIEPPGPQTSASAFQVIDTDPGMVMGTVNYMSPEQARGKTLDARTDIFSFGIVLYELVANRAPFAGESRVDVIVAILEKEPLPLAELAPEVPPELQRIISKTLRRERDERYQTMQGLLVDLKNLREEMQVQAKLERSGSLEPEGGGG